MKLTEFHKGMLKVDALSNQDIYANSLMNHGGLDPCCIVEAEIYTEINKDLGNKKFPNESKLKDKIDDLIEAYISTLKLDINEVGSFTKESGWD